MAAIYFHIPFCKQACHYCNFHFSTSLKHRASMLKAMIEEVALRQNELADAPLDSIYFGGGTPSLLQPEEIAQLIDAAAKVFRFSPTIEITLEMNPDDYVEGYFEAIKAKGVNRLSVGIQSFFEEELKQMNRAHNAQEAYVVLEAVKKHFDNFSLDLIYGMPGSSLETWQKNIDIALSFSPPHISSYALTVEDKTALTFQVEKNQVELLPEELVAQQFDRLVSCLTEAGFDHYELSNFGLPHYHSVNNSAYWQGKPYLGIGPSAHSFYANLRSWNVANNKKYIDGIEAKQPLIEREELSTIDQYNEFVMTGLRTEKGVALQDIKIKFGEKFAQLFEQQVEKHLTHQHLFWDGDTVKVTQKAKFLVDGIASDLFLLNLE
ncbi:MAG: radical SAM family heme chaperone HemW [Flavobacteriaceae bacterium]|nr:radical SAM family heme chaperone HemW [Flavobacteriaceae bacterium]